ncbi:hypothetical protein EV714DRAFT_268771 [Schizophyllum commune]
MIGGGEVVRRVGRIIGNTAWDIVGDVTVHSAQKYLDACTAVPDLYAGLADGDLLSNSNDLFGVDFEEPDLSSEASVRRSRSITEQPSRPRSRSSLPRPGSRPKNSFGSSMGLSIVQAAGARLAARPSHRPKRATRLRDGKHSAGLVCTKLESKEDELLVRKLAREQLGSNSMWRSSTPSPATQPGRIAKWTTLPTSSPSSSTVAPRSRMNSSPPPLGWIAQGSTSCGYLDVVPVTVCKVVVLNVVQLMADSCSNHFVCVTLSPTSLKHIHPALAVSGDLRCVSSDTRTMGQPTQEELSGGMRRGKSTHVQIPSISLYTSSQPTRHRRSSLERRPIASTHRPAASYIEYTRMAGADAHDTPNIADDLQ